MGLCRRVSRDTNDEEAGEVEGYDREIVKWWKTGKGRVGAQGIK